MFRLPLRSSWLILTIPIRSFQKTTTSEIRFRLALLSGLFETQTHTRANNDMKLKADDLFQSKNNSTEIQILLLYDDAAGKHNARMDYDAMFKTVAIIKNIG